MAIKTSIKLTPKRLSDLTTAVIIFITIIILFFVSLFLYRYFYQTITQSREILILREKVAIETVDMEKFNLIMDKLTKKTTPQELKNIISPFR